MKLKITVLGVTYEVDVEVVDGHESASGPVPAYVAPVVPPATNTEPFASAAEHTAVPKKARSGEFNGIIAHMAGTVIEIKCCAGDVVKRGETLLVVEIMKMDTNITSDKDAVVRKVAVQAGEVISKGQVLIEYE